MNCSWGQAINVANRYVYVSQPLKDRVLVISKIQMVVVDVSEFFSYFCNDDVLDGVQFFLKLFFFLALIGRYHR